MTGYMSPAFGVIAPPRGDALTTHGHTGLVDVLLAWSELCLIFKNGSSIHQTPVRCHIETVMRAGLGDWRDGAGSWKVRSQGGCCHPGDRKR